jgi:hypothetical protein
MRKLFTLLLLVGAIAYGQLNGTKTVGSGGDYATIASAIAALNASGVNGPLVFSLTDAAYAETGASLSINVPTNAPNSSNTVTFKPASGVQPVITITGCATSTDVDLSKRQAGFSFSNTGYVTFDGSNTVGGSTKDLTIKMNDGTNAIQAIMYYGNCDNVVVKNVIINYQTIPTSASTRGIYANGQASGAVDSMIVQNCTIGDATNTPYYAVSVTGSSGSLIYSTGVHIISNTLYGRIRPIYFFYVGTATTTSSIENNIVNVPGGLNASATYYSLFNTWNGYIEVKNNNFATLTTNNTATSGIFGFSALSAGANTDCRIFNNTFGGNVATTGTGVPTVIALMYIQDNGVYKIYNNSFLFPDNAKSTNRVAYYMSGASANVTLNNNIFKNLTNAANAYCIYKTNGTLTSNYNLFDPVGPLTNVGFLTSARNTLANWQSATSQDANSIAGVVNFVSATDLHINPDENPTSIASNAGTPIASVTTDIDGNTRHAVNPDLGADEFTANTSFISGIIAADTYSNLTLGGTATLGGAVTVTGTLSLAGNPLNIKYALSYGSLSGSLSLLHYNVPGLYATVNEAVAGVPIGTTVKLGGQTYAENVVVNRAVNLTGLGTTSVITPASGIGVVVSANNVTLSDFKVTGASFHGIYAGNVNNLLITNVTSTLNGGAGTTGSGVALQGVTGTSILTNVTATSNKNHGVEIGKGSTGVKVSGGTFSNNGVSGQMNTGGGIALYSDAGAATNGTVIEGTVTANNNYTAGIYLTCTPTGTLANTTIGASGTITLNDNGSDLGGGNGGGAAVIVYGPCSMTQITFNSTRSVSFPTAGLLMLGTDETGANSPTGTTATNCNLTGFNTTSPAGSMKVVNGGQTLICSNNVTADVGNTINSLSEGFAVEDVLLHKVDDLALGGFKGPGTVLYVTPNSGSIQRGIDIANNPYEVTQVKVQAGTYNENVTLNKAITLVGVGATTIIDPATGTGINVTVAGATIQDLRVTGAVTGISAVGPYNGLTISGVTVDNNSGEGMNIVGLSNVNISTTTASNNGTGTNGSGVNLGVATATVTDLTASGNKRHGLAIGGISNASNITVTGGTFTGNGVGHEVATGGGISINADVNKTITGVTINGTVTSSNNATAGIYVYSAGSTSPISTVSIGGTTSLTSNGGAGVIVHGNVTGTTISATFTKGDSSGAGVLNIGTDGSGTNSPSGTTISNSTFTGYTGSAPAITLDDNQGRIGTSAVTATDNVTFTDATTNSQIEAIIMHQVDNATLGLVSFTVPAPATLLVKAKVFLQGPFSSGSMSIALATANLVPLSQPYNTASFGNYAGTETAASTAFLSSNSFVDWVLVELRSTSNGAAVDRRAGLLKNNGTLCETDGTEGIAFSVATAGDYYIVIKHRNHIPVMSANTVTLPNASAYDFTTAQAQGFGTNPMAALTGGVFGLPTGDVEVNGGIAATDLTAIRNAIGLAVYTPYDVELNGGVAATDLTATRNNIGFASQLP